MIDSGRYAVFAYATTVRPKRKRLPDSMRAPTLLMATKVRQMSGNVYTDRGWAHPCWMPSVATLADALCFDRYEAESLFLAFCAVELHLGCSLRIPILILVRECDVYSAHLAATTLAMRIAYVI